MNEVLYRHLIEPWFDLLSRPILQRKDLWLLAHRRVEKNRLYHLLLADLCIHGNVCDRRYCICKYFDDQDKLDCYDRYYRFYLLYSDR